MKYFLAIGAILLLLAGLFAFLEWNFLNQAETVTGTVTDFDISNSDDGVTFCPVILFKTKSGQQVEYHANFCSSPRAYEVGDSVKVVYNPKDPKNVQPANFWLEYLTPLILLAVGLPLTAVGAVPMLNRK
jgi:uncharacterized protein DUF3592